MTNYLEPDTTVTAAYVELRQRVIDLVRSRPESDGDRTVLHCPDWTVRDLLAHMAGAPEDILAGRLDGVGTDPWTQAQVDRHRGESLAQLADAWEATGSRFDPVLPMIPSPMNSQLVFDAVTHEHDLRHALGVPGARDAAAVDVARGWALHSAELKSPGLAETLLSFGLEDFDVLRIGAGRRTREQIAALGVDAALIERLISDSPVSFPSESVYE